MGVRSLVVLVGIGGLVCGLAWWLWIPGVSGESATQPQAKEVRAEPTAAEALDAASPSSAVVASSRQPIRVETIAFPAEPSSRFSHPEWAPFERLLEGRILAAPRPELGETEPRPLPDFEVDFLVARAREAETTFKSLKTDSEGRFALDLRPLVDRMSSIAEARIAGWTLWPRDPARTLGGSSLDLTAWLSQPAEPVDFILGELGVFELSGLVIDESQAAGSRLFVSCHWGEGKGPVVPVDERGRFHLITRIPVDLTDRFRMSAEDRARLLIHDPSGVRLDEPFQIHDWSSSHIQLGTFRLPPRSTGNYWIEGTVCSQDGSPLPHWPLYCGEGFPHAKKTYLIFADAFGRFALRAGYEESTQLTLGQCAHSVLEVARAPEADLILRSKEPTILLSCLDSEGNRVPMSSTWSIRSSIPGPMPQEGQAVEFLGSLLATVPAPGEYQVRTRWMGFHGDWEIDQSFDVYTGHQEIVLQAEYMPHSTPQTDNRTPEGPSTPRAR